MGGKNELLFKEDNKKLLERKKSKLWDMLIPFVFSLVFLLAMTWFWHIEQLTLDFSSVLLIFGFIVFLNAFTLFNYLQLKKISPLRIYKWGIIAPEPAFLSSNKIFLSNMDEVKINQTFRFTGIFMSIYDKNGRRIGSIGNLNKDDVENIQNIFQERGIKVKLKI